MLFWKLVPKINRHTIIPIHDQPKLEGKMKVLFIFNCVTLLLGMRLSSHCSCFKLTQSLHDCHAPNKRLLLIIKHFPHHLTPPMGQQFAKGVHCSWLRLVTVIAPLNDVQIQQEAQTARLLG